MTPAGRLKLAELTSGVGALVLGLGLGALLAPYLSGVAVIVLAIGALMHGWGMFDRHRHETAGDASKTWWVILLYWACWTALAALAAYLLATGGRP